MSLVSIWARVCTCCGHDSARLERDGELHRLRCGNEGCRAVGASGITESAAVFYWNKLTIRRPFVPAQLREAGE